MNINVFPIVDAKISRMLARNTQWQADNGAPPTVAQFKEWLHAEESQLDSYQVVVQMYGIPYYSSVHFVRHHVGVTHYVSSQRKFSDRSEAPQGALVDHFMVLGPRALINISRKRLCNKADKMTVKIWESVKAAFEMHDDELMREVGHVMVSDCEYRGDVCHQRNSCGKVRTWDIEPMAW